MSMYGNQSMRSGQRGYPLHPAVCHLPCFRSRHTWSMSFPRKRVGDGVAKVYARSIATRICATGAGDGHPRQTLCLQDAWIRPIGRRVALGGDGLIHIAPNLDYRTKTKPLVSRLLSHWRAA